MTPAKGFRVLTCHWSRDRIEELLVKDAEREGVIAEDLHDWNGPDCKISILFEFEDEPMPSVSGARLIVDTDWSIKQEVKDDAS